jgi:uncharacterized protein (DUF2236 family)
MDHHPDAAGRPRRIAGSDTTLTMPPAADVSRRINAERLVLAGWLRALLLQLAQPLIAAGVAEHSSFRGRSGAGLSRLRQTVAAMLAITFGTDGEREQALEGIRTIHRRVNGHLAAGDGPFVGGTRYSAEDPALLLWVHATLVESVLLTYEQVVAPLTDGERDRYCADSADVAIALGARADAVPRTWFALRAYLEDRYASGEIVVGTAARGLAAQVLAPMPGWIGRHAVTPIASLLAAGQLPPAIRSQYGFVWSEGRARRFRGVLWLLRLLRRVTPRRLAWWRRARRSRRLSRRAYVATHKILRTD